MPLVDPVTTSMAKKDDSATTTNIAVDSNKDSSEFKPAIFEGPSEEHKNEWMTKLMGKTVKEDDHSEINFAKADLPEKSRVIKPGQMVTKDYRAERMNVNVDENDVVMSVYFG